MRRASPNRAGFTLIELLVVIVILALLVGLLLPAVMRAVGTARDAAVSAEIQALAQALASFKSRYNEYPPSRILCSETGDYSTGSSGLVQGTQALLVPRSISALKRYWPRLSLNTSTASGPAPGVNPLQIGTCYDFNGNGNVDKIPYILTGPECLVFFLGGIPQQSGGIWSTTGFSKSPTNPFQNTTVTTNRTAPEFEFTNARLISMPATLNPAVAPGGFPGYIDSLGSGVDPGVIPFLCYFSAYGGAGYDPGDADFNEPDTASASTIVGAFQSANAPTSVKYPGSNTILKSPAPNPYTVSCPVPTTSGGDVDLTNMTPRAWINANSYQLISAGRDRYFGIGGQYIGQGNTRLPFLPNSAVTPPAIYTKDSLQTQLANSTVTGGPVGSDIRSREGDNLTNFAAGGRLD